MCEVQNERLWWVPGCLAQAQMHGIGAAKPRQAFPESQGPLSLWPPHPTSSQLQCLWSQTLKLPHNILFVFEKICLLASSVKPLNQKVKLLVSTWVKQADNLSFFLILPCCKSGPLLLTPVVRSIFPLLNTSRRMQRLQRALLFLFVSLQGVTRPDWGYFSH